MPTDLERIEEKHASYLQGDGRRWCQGCRHWSDKGDPCDVVKLARALDDAATEFSRMRLAFSKGDSRHERCKYEAEKAERTLREVAG